MSRSETINPAEQLERTYMEPFSAEETEMLYRIVVLGILSGDATVRASVSRKVAKAKENAQLGRAWICTRDIIREQKAHGKAKERV